MPDPAAPPPGLPSLDLLLDALSAELPDAFFIPVGGCPPATTRPRSDRDWLLLPTGAHLGVRSQLMTDTFRWFDASVALFLGADTESDFEAFDAHGLGRGGHKLWWNGSVWAVGTTTRLSGDAVPALVDFLRERLPVVVDLDAGLDVEWFDRCEVSRKAPAPIRVFVRGALGSQQRQAVTALAHRFPNRVSLRLRLQQGLGRLGGALELRALVRADPPLMLTVVAENPLFATSAEVATRALTRSCRHMRAALAPRAE